MKDILNKVAQMGFAIDKVSDAIVGNGWKWTSIIAAWALGLPVMLLGCVLLVLFVPIRFVMEVTRWSIEKLILLALLIHLNVYIAFYKLSKRFSK